LPLHDFAHGTDVNDTERGNSEHVCAAAGGEFRIWERTSSEGMGD